MANVYGSGTPTITVPDNQNGPPLALKHGFSATTEVTVQKIRYYLSATEMYGRSVDFYIWTGTGAIAQSKTVTLPETLGWFEVTLDTPYTVAADTAFGVGLWLPTGAGLLFYGSGAAQLPMTNGVLTITGSGFDETTKTAGNPSGFSGSGSYFLDVEIGDTPLSVDAGADQAIAAGTAATVSAVASGGAGSKAYAWTVQSGGSGSFASASSASTTFTPSGAGTYVLRVTVSDDSGSAYDEITVTVYSALPIADVTSSTGWTPTGGTALEVLTDGSDSTYLTSPEDPDNALVDTVLPPLTPPTGDLVVLIRAARQDASSGSLRVRLYDESTQRAEETVDVTTTSPGLVTVTFDSADIDEVTSWETGVRMTIEASAS